MPDVSDYATLDLLDPEFAEDLVAAIESGIAGGVVFPSEPTVEAVFRSAVQAAVGAIKKGTARSCETSSPLGGPLGPLIPSERLSRPTPPAFERSAIGTHQIG